MFYYLNTFIVYSVFGFILESCVYKSKQLPYYSGILYGPFTIIYGFGCIVLNILNSLIFININNILLKTIITFSLSFLILTTIELLGAIILKYIFHTTMWDYSNRKYNYKGYICLKNSTIWGILGTLYILFLKNIIDTRINTLPNIFTKVLIFIIIINIIITIITKNKKLISNQN